MSSLLQALMAGLLAGLALHFSAFRRNFRANWHWECAAGVAAALLVFAAGGFWKPAVDRSTRPVAHADADAGFVSSGACQNCHPAQHASWQHSFHRTMTQEPTPETVIGNFEGGEARAHGVSYRLSREGDRFWAEVNDPEAAPGEGPTRHEIVLTTGSHHMQLYWYASGEGRELKLLPVAHDVRESRWFPLRSNFFFEPIADDARLTGHPEGWNDRCIHCHTTAGRPRIEVAEEVDTHVAEFGIACEACHGPGLEHAQKHREPISRWLSYLDPAPDPSIVNPARLEAPRSAEVCGRCHAVLLFPDAALEEIDAFGVPHRPGESLEESGLIVVRNEFQDPDAFWPDGKIRLIGREYTALLESECFAGGELSCVSCHTMHAEEEGPGDFGNWASDQLAAGMDGDAACVQCHAALATDVEAHTRHPAASSGSRCMNCHMPFGAIGLRKVERHHGIDSPSVATELASGRLNACNACHLDKSLGWTADRLAEWTGDPAPPLGEVERAVPDSIRLLLSGNAAQRAVSAWVLGWDTALEASGARAWAAPFLGNLLDDPYPPVRFMAYQSLQQQPGFADFAYDFVAPRTERYAQGRGAVDQWVEAREKQGETSEFGFLLDDPGQELDAGAIIADLARNRDDTIVVLSE